MDISHIECNHAQIRRLLRSRAETHVPLFSEIAADFLLLRHRMRRQQAGRPIPAAASQQPRPPALAKRRSLGGSQRAFMSGYLKGRPLRTAAERSAAMKEANAEYNKLRQEGGEALQRVQMRGSIGVIAARAGGHPFGAGRKRKARALVPDALRGDDLATLTAQAPTATIQAAANSQQQATAQAAGNRPWDPES